MMKKREELFVALMVYVVSIAALLAVGYKFLEAWELSEFNLVMIGILLLFIIIGWGYILTGIFLDASQNREEKLNILTNEIVHELNIPLSTIQANTNLLRRTIEDEKSLKRIARIEDASVRLQRLYDELLYMMRKETHSIQKEYFDIKDILEERVAVFREQKRNHFELHLSSYEIEADKIGFEQMIDNILENAMKYSSKDTTITLILDANRLCIEDRGIGMTTAELLRVHERYFQADSQKAGRGIGLALVKEYCESEEIEIVIHSQKDKGTKICLDFAKIHS